MSKPRAWLNDYDQNWLSQYDQVEYESDGTEDFYDESMQEGSWWDRSARGSLLSSAWSRGRVQKAEAEDRVRDLIEIRNTVHNLLKIHSLPQGTRVTLAPLSGTGKGCAGFGDMENFTQPFIMLDKAIYSECDSEEVLDVYCGVGLHEAGHLHNTRKLFKVLQSPDLSESYRLWLNLLEDERIERIEKKRSPGYAPYIQAATRALFENKELGTALNVWDEASDMDCVRMIIFSFLRTPHLLTDEMKSWTTMTGTHVYSELRTMLEAMPKTEDEVEEMAEQIEKYYRSLIEDLDNLSDDDASKVAGDGPGSSEGESGSGAGGEDAEGDTKSPEPTKDPSKREVMEAMKDIRKHHSGEEQDKEDRKTLEGHSSDERRHSREVGSDRDADALADESIDSPEAKAERRAKVSKEDIEKIMDSREGRFGEVEIAQMLKRSGRVTEGLDIAESDALASFEEERMERGDDWDCDGEQMRKTVIVHPSASDKDHAERYKAAYEEVRGHVARMRNVFALRLGERNFVETERQEGRLHRRMIGKAMSTNRLFKKNYKRVDKGISICLVLDESGSMGSVGYKRIGENRAAQALKIAVLISEALKKVEGVELEVYSYSSCGADDADNLVKYLYGKNNPNTASIGGFHSGCQNYDHIALKTAGDLFIKNTTNDNRMMIVLSDGEPAGNNYGGRRARDLTKKSVDDLEKRGIQVLQVAIESFDSESMFKNVVRFLDLGDLINKMRQLVTRVIKQAS
jgi:hypothetical protein